MILLLFISLSAAAIILCCLERRGTDSTSPEGTSLPIDIYFSTPFSSLLEARGDVLVPKFERKAKTGPFFPPVVGEETGLVGNGGCRSPRARGTNRVSPRRTVGFFSFLGEKRGRRLLEKVLKMGGGDPK